MFPEWLATGSVRGPSMPSQKKKKNSPMVFPEWLGTGCVRGPDPA